MIETPQIRMITPTEKKNETKLYKIIKSISFSSDVNDNIKVANYNLTAQSRAVCSFCIV